MRVTYQTCCGVDVHKSFLVATIIKTTGGIEPSYQKKRFSTFNNSILLFKQWLLDNNCHDVCMESTGKYWVPVFNLLEDEINVTIANPKWVKAVKGNKDDEKDSKWIGDLFRLGLVKGSYIPSRPIRILREYTRYRYKLVSCRSSEKNRYQNALTVCNVALDSVVSDIFGKSSTSIIDYLLQQSGTSINHKEIASKLLRSLKSKEDAVIVESAFLNAKPCHVRLEQPNHLLHSKIIAIYCLFQCFKGNVPVFKFILHDTFPPPATGVFLPYHSSICRQCFLPDRGFPQSPCPSIR